MIHLDFLPSRRLSTYLIKLFLTRSAAVLVGLVIVLMALDLLGESGKILAVPGNGEADLWRYVSLRLPILINRFLPFAVLLGTLIVFTNLNTHSEVVAMKAAGLSAHQILAPLLLAATGVAALHFAFAERVVVRSERMVKAWSDADYRRLPPDSGVQTGVWLTVGDDLVRVGRVIGTGAATRLEEVRIFTRDKGALTGIIHADQGRQIAGGWELTGVRQFRIDGQMMARQPTMTALAGVAADRFTLADVNPDALDFRTLRQSIKALEAAGRPTEKAQSGYWHKLSGPLSSLLMPLLAAVAAFGLARSGQVLARAAIGMALGFAYFVADNFSMAMGNAGVYSPLLAAWAPFILFALIGETVLIRSEE